MSNVATTQSCSVCSTPVAGRFCENSGKAAVEPALARWIEWDGFFATYMRLLRHPVTGVIAIIDDPAYRKYWSFLVKSALFCGTLGLAATGLASVTKTEIVRNVAQWLFSSQFTLIALVAFGAYFALLRLVSGVAVPARRFFHCHALELGFIQPILTAIDAAAALLIGQSDVPGLTDWKGLAMFVLLGSPTLLLTIAYKVALYRRLWSMSVGRLVAIALPLELASGAASVWLMYQSGYWLGFWQGYNGGIVPWAEWLALLWRALGR